MRNIKVYGFLKEPMKVICLVICSNYDYFHSRGSLFVRYIIFGKGIIIDEPDEETVRSIFDAYPDADIITIHGPCVSCIKRGITGPSGYNMPADYSDPEEKDEDYDDDDSA